MLGRLASVDGIRQRTCFRDAAPFLFNPKKENPCQRVPVKKALGKRAGKSTAVLPEPLKVGRPEVFYRETLPAAKTSTICVRAKCRLFLDANCGGFLYFFRFRVRYATTSSSSASLIPGLRVMGMPNNPCRTTLLIMTGVRSVRCSSTAGSFPLYFTARADVPAKAPLPNMTFLGATAPWQGAHHLSKTTFPFVSEGVWACAELPSPTTKSRRSVCLMRGSSSCLPARSRNGQAR